MQLGMLTFSFFRKTIVSLWKRWQLNENKTISFLKTIALQNDRCIKLAVSSRIVNEDPSLTIVNEERRREETTLKGIGTYHWAVLKKILRSFTSPHNFLPSYRQQSIKLHVISFFLKTIAQNDHFQKRSLFVF